ncbi:MAG: PAS domain S-box protein [Bacteroidota bacterium]
MTKTAHIDPVLYQQFFQQSDIGLIVEVDAKIKEANTSIASILGCDINSLIDSSFNEFVYEKDLSEYLAHCKKLNNGVQSHYSSELRLKGQSSKSVWVRVFCQQKQIEGSQYRFIQIEDINQDVIKNEIFDHFARIMAEVSEESILDSMVLNLTRLLHLKYAFIGFYNKKDYSIDVQSISIDNEIRDNFSYSLKGTPCIDVINSGCIAHTSKIQQMYPEDLDLIELNVEGYIGVSLTATNGEVIGHVVVMNDKPIENRDLIISILQIYSGRLASQIENQEQKKLLKKKEEYYRSLFNNSFEAKLIYSKSQNKILDANEATLKLFKFKKEEFIGLSLENIKPKKLESGKSSVDQIIENTEKLKRENRVFTDTLSLKSDGTIFETELALSYLDRANDQILVSYRDVSDKRRLQRIIETSERRYRSLFEHSFDAILVTNIHKKRFEYCNAQALKLFKLERNQIKNYGPLDVLSKTQRNGLKPEEVLIRNVEGVLNRKSLFFEANFVNTKGRDFQAEVSLLPIIEEEEEFALVVIKDVSEKKAYLNKLEQSEKRFRGLFENSFDAILLYNIKQNRFENSNDRVTELFKYSKQELMGMSPQQISAPQQNDGSTNDFNIIEHSNQLRKGVKLNFEYLFKKKNGTQFEAEVSLLPIKGEDQNYAIAVINDISDKKAYLNKIEQGKKRFKSLFDYSFDAILITDINKLKYIDCNPKAEKLFGLKREQINQYGPLDIYSKKQPDGRTPRQIIDRNIARLRNQNPCFHEANFINAKGEEFEGEQSILPILELEDGSDHAIVTIRDISAERSYQRALNERKEFLKTLINLNPVHIHVKNTKGEFLMANEAAAEFFGTNVENLMGKKAFDFPIRSIDKNKLYLYDSEVINNEKPIEIASRGFYDTKGKRRWFQTKKMPLFDNKGRVDRILSVSADITNRIEIEEQLRSSNEELQKVNQELDHFVYRASHDLRSPLASILGLVNLLRLENLGENSERYVDHIDSQIKKLDAFIKDIISYSRVSRLQNTKEEINFQLLINDIFESLKYHKKSKAIKKHISVDLKSTARCDRNKVSLILRNLISNAIKYSSSSAKNPYINCTVCDSEKNDGYRIIIEDNGIGIEEEQLPKIFDMFHRATEESDGSGLGLFIVKEAADKINADIKVESTWKKGTKFIIEIPE